MASKDAEEGGVLQRDFPLNRCYIRRRLPSIQLFMCWLNGSSAKTISGQWNDSVVIIFFLSLQMNGQGQLDWWEIGCLWTDFLLTRSDYFCSVGLEQIAMEEPLSLQETPPRRFHRFQKSG